MERFGYKVSVSYRWLMAALITNVSPVTTKVLAIYIPAKVIYPPYISFKSECGIQVAKNLKGDWFIVLQ